MGFLTLGLTCHMYQAPSSIQLGIGVKTTVGNPQMTGTPIPQQTQHQERKTKITIIIII